MKPKLMVIGAAGRMGKRIISLCIDEGRFDIIAAVEEKGHPDTGKDAGILAQNKAINVEIDSNYAKGANIAIDFSQPQAANATIDFCSQNNVALVLGTTGLSVEQIERAKAAGRKIPVIWASNMSMGMNLLFALVGKVAVALGKDYDIEIIEQHHRFKKDAPSGSAITLAQNICKETGKSFPDCITHGRSGNESLRQAGTIGMHAIRAGDITGIHEVIFSTLGETITLSHNAHNRDIFARGALRAAEWLVGKKPGFYSMADVLGIE